MGDSVDHVGSRLLLLLALASVVPLTAWANDRFGCKNVWIASMATFLLGSLLCGLANSMSLLIVARAVQGVGGGMLLPTGQTILAREAGPGRLGRVMSVVGIPSMLGPLSKSVTAFPGVPAEDRFRICLAVAGVCDVLVALVCFSARHGRALAAAQPAVG